MIKVFLNIATWCETSNPDFYDETSEVNTDPVCERTISGVDLLEMTLKGSIVALSPYRGAKVAFFLPYQEV